MQPKHLQKLFLILAIVLVVLVVAFLIIYFTLIRDVSPEEPENDTKIKLWELSQSEVGAFSYDYQGKTVSLTRRNGRWYVDGEADDFYLNQALIVNGTTDAMLYKCCNFTFLRKVLDECNEPALYGLQMPSLTVRFQRATTQETFYFGNRYAQSESRYCMRAGDPALYLVEESYFTAFAYTKEGLLNHPFSFAKAEDQVFVNASLTDSAGTHPITDAQTLGAFAQKLSELHMKESTLVDYHANTDLAQYGLGETERRTVTLTYYDSQEDQSTEGALPGQYTLCFGKTDGERVYVASPDCTQLVYAITLSQYQALMQFFSL